MTSRHPIEKFLLVERPELQKSLLANLQYMTAIKGMRAGLAKKNPPKQTNLYVNLYDTYVFIFY